MKIKRSLNKKKLIVLAATIAVVLSAGSVFAYYHYVQSSVPSSPNQPTVNLSPATEGEKSAGDQVKASSAPTTDTSSNSAKNTGSATAMSAPGPTAVTVRMTANAQNGSTYQLRYLIDAVLNGATCTLTLTQGSQTITRTASVQALAQSSTCQGFDIPMSGLSSGSWQANMTVSGGNVTGSTQNTIQIQ